MRLIVLEGGGLGGGGLAWMLIVDRVGLDVHWKIDMIKSLLLIQVMQNTSLMCVGLHL